MSSKKPDLNVSLVSAAVVGAFLFIMAPVGAQAATSGQNLILNPLLTATSTSNGQAPNPSIIPQNWQADDWGDAATASTTFTFPASDWTGVGNGANITIANDPDATSTGDLGDGKWIFDNVAVTPGTEYLFSDNYISNAPSIVLAAWNNGSLSNQQLIVLPSSNGTLATASASLVAPVNATDVTIYHLLDTNGSLTTGNFSLTAASVGPTTFPTALVSMTFDDGWQSQYDYAMPILQSANMPGTFYIITNTMATGGLNTLFTNFAPGNETGVTVNCDGDPGDFCATTSTLGAVWNNTYPDPNGDQFIFSDTYASTATTTVTISYTPASSTTAVTETLATLPSTNGVATSFTASTTLPVLNSSTPIDFTHESKTGTTTITAAALQENLGSNGYLSTSEIQQMQADGEEIGAHTMDHCDLVMLENNSSSAEEGGDLGPPAGACASQTATPETPAQEIDGSRAALLAAGLTPVDDFAYPYGSYDANVESIVKQDGFASARSVNLGYNFLTSDPYALNTEIIDATTTLNPDGTEGLPQVESWINTAEQNHAWLILLMHEVEPTSTLIANNDVDGTTPGFLQQVVNYLASQQASGNLQIKTVHDVMTQYYNQTATSTTPTTVTFTTMGGTLNPGQVGTAYTTFNDTVSDAVASDTFTISITNGSLPAGLTFSTTGNTFIISGTPTAAASSTFAVTATSASDPTQTLTQTYTLNVAPAPAIPTGTLNVTLDVDNTAGGTATPSDFTVTLFAANPSPTSTFSGDASGTAITINASPATYSMNVSALQNYIEMTNGQCSDPSGITASTTVNCVITETFVPPVVTISPTSLPDATVGSAYSQTITASDGEASDTFTWAIASNTLSSDFTIATSTSGITISGNPKAAGVYQLAVTAISAISPNSSSTQSYSLTVNAAPTTGGGAGSTGGGSTSGGGGGGTISGGGGGGGNPYIPPHTSTGTVGVVLGASSTNISVILRGLTQQLLTLEKELAAQEFKDNNCSYDFTKNLSVGMNNAQVKNLQTALNYAFTPKIPTTGYFGVTTRNTVVAFQDLFAAEILTPSGLTSGNGIVGSSTRAELNTLCSE